MTGDDGRVGPDLTGAAVVACCIVGLVLVAGFLPAVDQVDGGGVDGVGDDAPDRTDESDRGDDGPGEGGGESAASRELDVTGTTPGQQMRVKVTGGDGPVSGATVTVDGEPAGTTDEDGLAKASVPYEESVTVTASKGDWSESDRVSLSTDVDVSPEYVDADDETLRIAATLDHSSVPNATVLVGGEPVAETDGEGFATVDLPSDRAEIEVRRGAAAGGTSIETDSVEVTVGNALFLPLVPGGPATARVTMDDVPVRDAPVTVDGDRAGRTNEDGRTRVRLPAADTAAIRTAVGGRTDATELEGLVFTLAWTALGTLSVLFGFFVSYLRLFDLQARRRHRRLIRDRLWRGGLVTGLVSAIVRAPAAALTSARSATSLFGRFGSGVGWLSQFGATLRLPRVALPSLSSLGAGLSSLSLLPSLDRGSRSVGGEDEAAIPDDDGPTATTDAPATEADDEPTPTVRRAWHGLVDRLGVPWRETRTPGQIARRAIDAGFPADAVDRLTAAFRDVEYGGRAETDDRIQSAYEALDRIRSEEEDDR